MDIKEVLRLHGLWLAGDPAGVRADLRDADLRDAYLRRANLIGADLRRANLIGADLRDADLRDAYLRRANLIGADLRDADLRDADLRRADLRDADLRRANLIGADLRDADLRRANLIGAYLPATVDGCVGRLDLGDWSICVYHNRTQIGCRVHDNGEWLSWSPESPEIAAMDSRAAKWWQTHGDAVKAVIRCVMAKAARYAEVKSNELD